jgi:hypothetical protein
MLSIMALGVDSFIADLQVRTHFVDESVGKIMMVASGVYLNASKLVPWYIIYGERTKH